MNAQTAKQGDVAMIQGAEGTTGQAINGRLVDVLSGPTLTMPTGRLFSRVQFREPPPRGYPVRGRTLTAYLIPLRGDPDAAQWVGLKGIIVPPDTRSATGPQPPPDSKP